MMSYEETHAKWHAFKFKDPFAADKFYTCNKETKLCCRPNCDVNQNNEAPDNISFVGSTSDAVIEGYRLCQHCLPNLESRSDFVEDENFVVLNLELLFATMKFVNESIGFVPPLLGSNDSFLLSQVLKINNIKLKKKLLKMDNIDAKGKNAIDIKATLSKGDMEQLKRIDMACRHITLAAQSTVFGVHFIHNASGSGMVDNSESENFDQFQVPHDNLTPSPNGDTEEPMWTPKITKKGCFWMQHRKLRTKRRRGGVLGFKELAAKSRISPWHFYRTFKSMTGVTPKEYGDRCFHFLYSHKKECYQALNNPESIVINAKLANPSLISNKNGSTISKPSHSSDHTSLTTPPSGSVVKNEPTESDSYLSSPLSSLGDSNNAGSLFASTQQLGLNTSDSKEANSIPITNASSADSESTTRESPYQSDYCLLKNPFQIQQSIQRQPTQAFFTDTDFSPGEIDIIYETPDTATDDVAQFKFINSGNQYMDDILNLNGDDNTFGLPSATDSFSELQKFHTHNNEPLDAFEIDQPFLLKQLQLQNVLEKRYIDKGFLYVEDESNFDSLSTSDFGAITND